MDSDPREVVLDQLVAELPGTTMNPSQVRRAASKGEMQAVVEEEIGALGGAEMLTALTQILIEKGLLDHGEIAQRIRTLRSSKAA